MSEGGRLATVNNEGAVVEPAIGELETRLGYLLHRTDLLHMDALKDLLAPIGLTAARATAIVWIHKNPGTGQSDLARALGINRASAMEIAVSMEKIGLIERGASHDQRATTLTLTAAGAEKYGQFIVATIKTDELLSSEITPAEYLVLTDLLRRVRASLHRHQTTANPTQKQKGTSA